jgi:hypothetical protein
LAGRASKAIRHAPCVLLLLLLLLLELLELLLRTS